MGWKTRKRERKLKSAESNSVNGDLFEIIGNYFKFSTRREKLSDIGIPLFISFLLFLISCFFQHSNNKIVATLFDFNNTALYVVAILAGFNTTSLTLIATANRDALQKLYLAGNEPENRSILKQLITFFAYSIFIGIFILTMGLLFGILAKSLPDIYIEIGFIPHEVARFLLNIFVLIYFSAVIHNLLASIRNISILYRFIFFISKKG